jgi:8-oxo-dGTP pyrophosphatase MutT (NUDIX family)
VLRSKRGILEAAKNPELYTSERRPSKAGKKWLCARLEPFGSARDSAFERPFWGKAVVTRDSLSRPHDAMADGIFCYQGEGVKQQCVLYITKDKRLLAFEQPDPRWSQTQVIKAALEPFETPLQAASRILQLESGLTLGHPILLDSQIWEFSWEGELSAELVHYVWFQAPTETSEAWTINGSSNEFDQPRTYQHKFVPLENLKLEWEMALGLPKLFEAISARERVVCYITRNRNKLLVFDHNDPHITPETQVVAGGIDDGETLAQAAIREVFEESGLKLEKPIFLGSELIQPPPGFTKPQLWHYFWFETFETRDSWDHTVTGGGEAGEIYQQHFVKLENAKLAWKLDLMLERLKL